MGTWEGKGWMKNGEWICKGICIWEERRVEECEYKYEYKGYEGKWDIWMRESDVNECVSVCILVCMRIWI